MRLLPELRGFARFLSRDRIRADDLVQETVMRALSASAQFEHGTNLKAWLFTILRNFFYEQVRRRKRETALLDELGMEPDGMSGSADGGDALRDLDRLIWQLRPLLREALVLVGAQEMTYEQASAICGVEVGTMKARVSRARRSLIDLRDEPDLE